MPVKALARVSSITPALSPKGHLVFANVEMLKSYVNDISTGTYGNLLEDYDVTGFTSLYQANGSPIAEGQLINGRDIDALILSQKGIIEIAGTIFKYSENSPAFLTTPSSGLNDATYEALENFTFVPSSMNLINPSDSIGGGLFEFLAARPTGYISPNPTDPIPQARRFFGREDKEKVIYNYNGEVLNIECEHTFYVFWFRLGEPWTTAGPC